MNLKQIRLNKGINIEISKETSPEIPNKVEAEPVPGTKIIVYAHLIPIKNLSRSLK